MASTAIPILALLCLLLAHQGDADIGLTSAILPVNFFQPKWKYNTTDIVYPYDRELDNQYVCKTGTNIYGTNTYQAMLTLAPCNYITEHYHPEADENNYIFTGSLSWWIVLGNGSLINGTAPSKSLLLLPQGLTHVLLNDNCNATTFFHFFPIVNPIFSFTLPAVEIMPARFLNSSFTSPLPADIIPDGIHTVDLTCAARCGINITKVFNGVSGPYASGFCNFLAPIFLQQNTTNTTSSKRK